MSPLRLLSLHGAYSAWIGLTGAAFIEAAAIRYGNWAIALLLSPLFFVVVGMGQTGILIGALRSLPWPWKTGPFWPASCLA